MKFGKPGSTKVALGMLALVLAAPLISGCYAPSSIIMGINLCATVTKGGKPMSEKAAWLSMGLATKDGKSVPLGDWGPIVLDTKGYGCAGFYKAPSPADDFGFTKDFAATYQLTRLSVRTENGTVEGTLISHNLHGPKESAGVSDPDYQVLAVNALFDYDHPNTEDPGQISRYLLRQLFKRKKTSESETSDQMATKTVEPRQSEIPQNLKQEAAGTNVL